MGTFQVYIYDVFRNDFINFRISYLEQKVVQQNYVVHALSLHKSITMAQPRQLHHYIRKQIKLYFNILFIYFFSQILHF